MALRLKAGELVLVQHGASRRGQIALVESQDKTLVKVRKWFANGQKFGENALTLPLRMILGRPGKDDERATLARAKLAAGPAEVPAASLEATVPPPPTKAKTTRTRAGLGGRKTKAKR